MNDACDPQILAIDLCALILMNESPNVETTKTANNRIQPVRLPPCKDGCVSAGDPMRGAARLFLPVRDQSRRIGSPFR
jgi:hypothetical protein